MRKGKGMKSSVNPCGMVNRSSSPLNIAVAVFWMYETGRDWQPCALCWSKSSLGFKLFVISSSKTKVPQNRLLAIPDLVFGVCSGGGGGLVSVHTEVSAGFPPRSTPEAWAEQSVCSATGSTDRILQASLLIPLHQHHLPVDVQRAYSHVGPSAGRTTIK